MSPAGKHEWPVWHYATAGDARRSCGAEPRNRRARPRGLPLEEGLRQIAADDSRGPGKLAAELEVEMSAGKSLPEAIAAKGNALPRVYRAIVEAGLKANRLPAALEGFAESAVRVADLRRIALQSAVYPLIVFLLAVVFFAFLAAVVLPGYQWLEIDNRIWAMPLAVSPRTARMWAFGISVVVVTFAIVWWRRTANSHRGDGCSSWLAWIPGASRAAQLTGQANFAEMLSLMVSCRVPLDDALHLAGRASGQIPLQRSADRLSVTLASGQPLAAQIDAGRGLPALVRTVLWSSATPDGMVAGLARAASVYRDRASNWVSQLALAVPVAATLAVGLLVVGVYAVLVLQPYIATLKEAASWY